MGRPASSTYSAIAQQPARPRCLERAAWAAALLLGPCLLATLARAAPAPLDGSDSAPTHRRGPLPHDDDDERIVLRGNKVLDDDVYRSVIDLPRHRAITRKRAKAIARRLEGFLHRAGFELAVVTGSVRKHRLVLDIDEGRLDKIIFPRESALSTIRVKVLLDIPHDVFNRPHFDAQLKRLAKEHDIHVHHYELVPVSPIDHLGPQLSALGQIRGVNLVPQPGRYSLHIYVEEQDLPPGFHIDAGANGPDGLILGLKYRHGGLLFADERWEVRTALGMRVQDILAESEGLRFISRGGAELKWYSPRFLGRRVRASLSSGALFINRQRLDLGVQSFDDLIVEGLLALRCEPAPWINFTLGGGLLFRKLLQTTEGEDPTFRVEPRNLPRAQISATMSVLFGEQVLRLDRRHELTFEARHLFPANEDPLTSFYARYEKTFAFGWHELEIESAASTVFGRVAFTEEIWLGRHLRGVFGDRYFSKAIGSLSTEFRWSISREYYHIGAFAQVAVYRGEEPPGGSPIARVANSFGPGFHALIFDTFQFSLYVAFGFNSDGNTQRGIALSLSQVF